MNPEHGPQGRERAQSRERQPELEPRIYVASLSDYNAGRLHGDWIDAAQGPEAIHAAISAMLARSREPVAEEWAIHDYENFGPLRLGEWESIEHISALGLGIAEHGQAFAAWADLIGSSEWDDLLGDFEDHYMGRWSSEVEYAENLLEDMGIDLQELGPEFLRPYISVDLDAFARDLRQDDTFIRNPPDGWVYVFDLP